MATAVAQDGWSPSRSAAGAYSPWLIVAIISIPTFMEVLDTSIANVALDHIAGGLSISADQATWVLTSYLVANAIVIPISGWLSDAIGRKRYFLFSILLFTLSSLMCGLAPNLTTLVIARVLQGVGGGGLAPVEQSILADTFPPRQRGMAFAAFAIVVVVGPVLGPTLGGYITEFASWHWVFLINVPVGIAAWVAVEFFVDEPEQVKKDRAAKFTNGRIRIDYIGVLLVALGLGFLEITMDRGLREDWFASPFIVATAIISGVSLIALVIWELNHDDPVVDLRLMKNLNFSLTLVVMAITGLILFGTTQLIPQMLQQVLGYSSLDAGLARLARVAPAGAELVIASGFDAPGSGFAQELGELAQRRTPRLLMIRDDLAANLPPGSYPIRVGDGGRTQVRIDARTGPDAPPDRDLAGFPVLALDAGAPPADTARLVQAAFPADREP